MKKCYYVYFKNNTDTVYMGVDKKRKTAFATLNINEAREFNNLEEAKLFIDLIKSKSKNSPNFQIIDFVEISY